MNAIAPPSSLSRWTRAKTNAADTGITPLYSLRQRNNLTSVSNVCEAAPKSLFCPQPPPLPNNFLPLLANRLPFLKVQSWRVFKSLYISGDPEQGFQPCFADGFNQSLVSSVARANHRINIYYASINKLKVLSEFKLRFSGNDQEILCALGNICHSETADKESFSYVAKFDKIDGEILHDCSRNAGDNAQEWSIWFVSCVF